MMLGGVVICLATFVILVVLLRRDGVSLGLPISYLGSLLLIHVPGAIAHLFDKNNVLVQQRPFTEVGISLTALGAVCFVAGVALANLRKDPVMPRAANRTTFARFCLIGGAAATVLSFMFVFPSIRAIIERGGLIWMLAIVVGLRGAVLRGDRVATWRWLGVLILYPVLMLIFGGFLSYGVAAMITVLAAVVVVARSGIRVAIACVVASVIGISVFLSYFENRTEIRGAVWGGAPVETRVGVSLDAFRQIKLFNPANEEHLVAINARLNQNYFAGLAATRISNGDAQYLHGRTIWEGFLAIIPRVFWPDKTIVAGSGTIVAEMTGLQLSRSTSFGVGNVMEFQINFGIPGIVIGFLLLGFLLRRLDRKATESYEAGELGNSILYYLPAVAMIQPNGSMVEVIGGAVAALIAAYGWRWAWTRWPKPLSASIASAPQMARTFR
ncbi:MAG TPA: hypothetical protein VJL35_13540 [Gemmatimonadaceae bacterium]|nr:hypothetical protein [Gemmatimonadaceae bacterium]